MKSNPIPLFTIVIDSRESRHPWEFPGLAVVRAKLNTGDYSIQGHEHMITIERKTKEDAWACIGPSRERFEACLARLSVMPHKAILIEADLTEFIKVPAHCQRLNPAMAVGSYLSWGIQYGVWPIFCGSREYAARACARILASYWKHHENH